MHPKRKGQVSVEPYTPQWAMEFELVREMLRAILTDSILSIDHVGSTSIPGMWAKPILDIDVVIDCYERFDAVKSRLAEHGFIHEGNEGVEGREVFHRSYFDEFMPYHLYVCTKDAPAHVEHLLFRDYMIAHPAIAEEYARVKRALAQKHSGDIDAYFREKCHFVGPIMEEIRAGGGSGE